MPTESLTGPQLLELRTDLSRLKSELTNQLASVQIDSQPVKLDQQLVGRLSRMDAMQQQQMAVAGQQQVKNHLRKVMLALNAIESEDYSYCSECGEDIGFPRLKVQPEAKFCLKCQQAAE
jgi:DnaK suppressor protein